MQVSACLAHQPSKCIRSDVADNNIVFRLDALALSVIATATWLAGWLGGWVSVTAGIVSKRLKLSENFLDLLVGPSFKHLVPLTPIRNSTGTPSSGR